MPPSKKPAPKPVEPNSEQREVIQTGEGFFSVLAGPGAGKSFCLTQRYIRLVQSGVPADSILSLTFTASAASSMKKRAEEQLSVEPTERLSGWMTFHSLALAFCTREREHFPFKLADNPLCLEPVAAKIAHDAAKKYEIDPRTLRPWISLQKRNRVRPPQALKIAEKEGKNEKLALAYKYYDARLKEAGVLDFDSLLLEMVDLLSTPPRGQETSERFALTQRWQYQFVQTDEAQDNDALQWQLLRLMTQQYGNLLAVGDGGQCQPPGTMVRVLIGDPNARISKHPRCTSRKPHFFNKATGCCTSCGHDKDDINPQWDETKPRGQRAPYLEDRPIETLTSADKVVSWTKNEQRLYPTAGRSIKTAKRYYEGDMLTVSSNGTKTRMTPDHWVWARFSMNAFSAKPYFVYLMYRHDRGFRIGVSHIRRGGMHSANQLTQRGKSEKADKLWILKFCHTRAEAYIQEEVIGVNYRITQSVFQTAGKKMAATDPDLKTMFSLLPRDGGFVCLKAHGLSFAHPLVEWSLNNHQKFRGYVRIRACNLAAKYMEMPTCEINGSAVIDNITHEHYKGFVYSLDVEKDHTYVADGIPVGNCIYSFRGSSSHQFLHMHEIFPGAKTLYLAKNHRSTPQVVELCKQFGPIQDLAERFWTTNPDGPPVSVVGYPSAADEAEAVVRGVVPDMAVLARTNRALRPVEDAFSIAGVKYYTQGKSGFWSQPEVKAVLAYTQAVVFPSDAAVLSALRSPFHPARYIKKVELAAKVKARPEGVNVITFLSRYPDDKVRSFVHFLDGLRRHRDLTPHKALSNVLQELRAFDYYKEEESADNSPVENLQELLKMTNRFSSVKDFLDYTRRASAASKSKKGVCLSTVHAYKGLEADTVYFIALNEGILPHAKSESLEDEKNVAFVGISRAKRCLNLSYAGIPSPFLKPFIKSEEQELEELFA